MSKVRKNLLLSHHCDLTRTDRDRATACHHRVAGEFSPVLSLSHVFFSFVQILLSMSSTSSFSSQLQAFRVSVSSLPALDLHRLPCKIDFVGNCPEIQRFFNVSEKAAFRGRSLCCSSPVLLPDSSVGLVVNSHFDVLGRFFQLRAWSETDQGDEEERRVKSALEFLLISHAVGSLSAF